MRLENPAHPGRAVRLGYGLNLHPAEDLDGVLDGMRRITLPLAERLGGRSRAGGFGVGVWLPADVALELATPEGSGALERYIGFLCEHELDAFTFNAFPYGGFHRSGLKEAVFRPTWKAPERLAFTLAVARIAAAARHALRSHGALAPGGAHLSISTHSGLHASAIAGEADLMACAENLAQCALHLAQLEDETGERVVLSIEPEPRSLANDTRALPALLERVRVRSRGVLGRGFRSLREACEEIIRRHVGACLDTCHAAVEFEEPEAVLTRATAAGTPLGKLQFSSALALERPDENEPGRERLFALDEPVYLHQVTGRGPGGLVRAGDLPELAAAWRAGSPDWRGCDSWRCHFHVPVDLSALGAGAGALATTRDVADRILARALAAPERWGTDELHVEIETYTWSLLPGEARGSGQLVDGLEREYRHVLERLATDGWSPVGD